jgi:hypothetical protein
VFNLGLRNGQERQQLGIQRGELVGQHVAQHGIGDLARARQHRHALQGAAVSMADHGGAEGVVAVVAGKVEQLSDARLDVGELLKKLLFQFVGFGRGGEPVLEVPFVDQGQSAVQGVAGGLGLHRARLFQRIQHLLHKLGLHGCRMLAEFRHRVQEPAVFGNAGCACCCRVQLVGQHAHHLVMHLQQGLVQQRRTDFAQMGGSIRGRQGSQFLPVAAHAQLLQRTQRIDGLPDKYDTRAEWAQALEFCGDAEGLSRVGRRRGEDDFHLVSRTIGQRGNRSFRMGEFEEQATHAEIADFTGDFGVPRLRDDGRLRDLEASVAPLVMHGVLNVYLISHHFDTLSFCFFTRLDGSGEMVAVLSPVRIRPLKGAWRDSPGFGRLHA